MVYFEVLGEGIVELIWEFNNIVFFFIFGCEILYEGGWKVVIWRMMLEMFL